MPIYEYKCESCGHEMEAIQKFSDAPLKDCPDCGKPTLKKQLSAAAFHLKGAGWYKSDFSKSQDNKKSDKSDSDSAPAAHTCCGGGACSHSS